MRAVLSSGPKVETHVRRIARDVAKITFAVARKDADAARKAMRRHVEAGSRLNAELAS